MALPGLLARLNCAEYKNWVKAGQCLLMLQRPLQGYIDCEMRTFHRQLADRITGTRGRCPCRAQGKQFQPNCPVCVQWKKHLLAHHNYRDGEIHWGNSDPSLWSRNHWEVAKVYMPRGQDKCAGFHQCDAAALLNLINTCDHFGKPNLSRVREIIKCRNELMHSSDMMVSSPWLRAFGQKMHNLITEFTHVPALVREGGKIQEVLLSDWNVEDLNTYDTDGPCTQGASSLIEDTSFSPGEVEIQLIQQLLQELNLEIEEQGSLTEEHEDKVRKMKTFFSENEDLRFLFQEDLEKLESLWRSQVPLNVEG